ncbi:MAG: [protein-PII] uridylyltransferase [Verrucomicrobia bacterium]|nr:[protein-PII] uridylyltransferase [Verrucomicrobiota bacterium]
MSKSLQKMLRHAKSALETSLHGPPAERVGRYQDFLKIENRRLLSLHRAGAGGMDVARGRSTMMDTLLHYVFRAAIGSEPMTAVHETIALELCLVATGGYGRGELNPCSDVDVLFLLPGARGPTLAQTNAVVEQVLYPLWDLGLKVGHATRTIGECVEQAGKDMQARTALLEARFLEGSREVFAAFQRAMEEDCLSGHAQEYIRERLDDQARRHSKHGESVFVQEPNVKNGCGGLRDLQSLLWIARFKAGIQTLEPLQQRGLLAQIEAGRLNRAYDFLMRVRNELHYANRRAVDEITLSAQPRVAEALGYRQRDVLRRIEAFMRDYYRHARDIYVLTESLAERMALEEEPRRGFGRWSRLFSFGNRVEKLEGCLVLKDGMIEFDGVSRFPSSAHDLMRVFRLAQIRDARIGAGLQSLIRNHLKLVNREFLYSSRAREVFLSILRSKGEVGRILRAMHECGFLGRYFPEFGKLDCLVQHEFYHRYTADEHTLLAIEKLDDVLNATVNPAAAYSRIFQQLENPGLLYLAILLHDTGKGVRTRHHSDASAECAQRVARRFCMDNESHRTLIWMVDHHMTMSSLAQRRDIEDPSTIEDFVEIVGTRERLDMLHLLTFVDGQAVGGGVWNEWRQSLLWQLHDRAARALSASGVERVDAETQRERLRSLTASRLPVFITEDEIAAHFAQMPSRYWRRIDDDELVWHFEILHAFLERLMDEASEGAPVVVRWRHFPDRAYSEAVVCSWDRHGLFAKIAGSFAASRINILNADIYTRSDDLVLDIFQVCDLEHHAIQDASKMAQMEQLLALSLGGNSKVSFTDAIRQEYESMRHIPHQDEERFPTVVTFNNDDSRDYTILEIQTPDRLGLLHHILQVLTGCGLDIGLAKISTEKGAAMDVFYLTDTEGRKVVEPDRLASVRNELLEAVETLNAPYRHP